MITKTFYRNIFTIIVLSAALTFFIARPAFSQDTLQTKGEKKVRITAKIIEDKSGKRQVFDTTFNLDRKLKAGEEKEIMKEIEIRLKCLDDQMKDLELDLSDLALSDSEMMDSVHGLTKKDIMLKVCPGKGRPIHNCCPQGFSFDCNFDEIESFDRPCAPFDQFGNGCAPGMFDEKFLMMNEGKGESLNDLLGDIPMDRVTSYSIKETKNGKRITIELKNEPFIEHDNNVIILRSPGPEGSHGQGQQHQMRKKVIIKDESHENEE